MSVDGYIHGLFIQDGDTPLHEAARGNHSHTVMALINLGARIDAINNVS